MAKDGNKLHCHHLRARLSLLLALACTLGTLLTLTLSPHPATAADDVDPGPLPTFNLPDTGLSNGGGGAQTSVPIATPKGRGGLSPKLSIDYQGTSLQNTGGLNFSLDTGLPTISRETRFGCPTLKDEEDTFLLGADRLVRSGSDQNGATVYDTETQGFLRIWHRRNQDQYSGSSDHWLVKYPNGDTLVLEPGEYADDPQGNTGVFSWVPTELIDTRGRYIQYIWDNKSLVEPPRLTGVVWTRLTDSARELGADAPSSTYEATLKYSDQSASVSQLASHSTCDQQGPHYPYTKRLDRIDLSYGSDSGGTAISSYLLQHNKTDPQTKAPVLTDVVQQGSPADSKEKTSFNYYEGTDTPYKRDTNSSNNPSVGVPSAVQADLSGDGRSDVVEGKYGSTEVTADITSVTGNDVSTKTTWKKSLGDLTLNKLVPAELIGDGQKDLFVNAGGRWLAIYSTPGGFSEPDLSAFASVDPAFKESNGDRVIPLRAHQTARDDIFIEHEVKVGDKTVVKWKLLSANSQGDYVATDVTPCADDSSSPQWGPCDTISTKGRRRDFVTGDVNGDGLSDLMLVDEYYVLDDINTGPDINETHEETTILTCLADPDDEDGDDLKSLDCENKDFPKTTIEGVDGYILPISYKVADGQQDPADAPNSGNAQACHTQVGYDSQTGAYVEELVDCDIEAKTKTAAKGQLPAKPQSPSAATNAPKPPSQTSSDTKTKPRRKHSKRSKNSKRRRNGSTSKLIKLPRKRGPNGGSNSSAKRKVYCYVEDTNNNGETDPKDVQKCVDLSSAVGTIKEGAEGAPDGNGAPDEDLPKNGVGGTVGDLNGDGLADIVSRVNTGSEQRWQVRLSTGHGFTKPKDWNTKKTITYARNLTTINADGDSCPDIGTSEGEILRGTCQSLTSSEKYSHTDQALDKDVNKTGAIYTDLDADGVDDLYTDHIFTSTYPQLNRLKGVTNPIGGKTTLTYKPAPKNPRKACPTDALVLDRISQETSSIKVKDQSLSYTECAFDFAKRTSLGFKRTNSVDNLGPQAGSGDKKAVTETTYYQDYPRRGQKASEKVSEQWTASSGMSLERPLTLTTYSRESDQVAPYFTPLQQKTETTFGKEDEGNQTEETATHAYQYDTYGNRIKSVDVGLRTTYTPYYATTRLSQATPGTPYLARAKVFDELFNTDGGLLTLAKYGYDGNKVDAGDNNGPPAAYAELTQTLTWAGGDLSDDDSFVSATTSYDQNGNVDTTTDPKGQITSFTYDDKMAAFVTAKTQERQQDQDPNTPDKPALTTKTTPSLKLGGKPTSVTDPNDARTVYMYDGLGRKTRVLGPNNGSDPTEVTSYLDFGNPLKQRVVVERQRNYKEDTAKGPYTRTFFDGFGRTYLTASRAENGKERCQETFSSHYGAPRWQTVPYLAPKPVSQLDYSGCSQNKDVKQTITDFDVLGRPTKVVNPKGQITTTTYNALTTTVDGPRLCADQITTKNDVFGRKASTTESFDACNPKSTEPATEATTTYAYDAADRLTEVWKADNYSGGKEADNGAQPIERTTYDPRGLPLTTWSADRGTHTTVYDQVGNPTYTQSPNQANTSGSCDYAPWQGRACTKLTYDDLNRLSKKTHMQAGYDAKPATFTYDIKTTNDQNTTCNPKGNRTGSSHDGVNRSTCYDNEGRTNKLFTQIRGEPGQPVDDSTIRTTYDALSNPITTIYPDAQTVTRTYTDSGLLNSISTSSLQVLKKVYYDRFAKPDQVNFADGSVDKTTRSDLGLPTHTQTVMRDERIADVDMTYDAAGNLTDRTGVLYTQYRVPDEGGTVSLSGKVDINESFTYDSQSRLTQAKGPYTDKGLGGDNTTLDYGLNQDGTFKSYKDAAANYDDTAHRHALTKLGDPLTSPCFTYDPSGNLTNTYQEQFLDALCVPETVSSYNPDDRLQEFKDFEKNICVNYLYDADGVKVRRVTSKLEDGQTCDPTNPSNNPQTTTYVSRDYVKESDDSTTLYIKGPDGSVAARRNSKEGLRYYHQDAFGNPQQITHDEGVDRTPILDSVFWREPFGKLIYRGGADGADDTKLALGRYLFQGNELDQGTGLYDFNLRQYDADIAQFAGADPISDPAAPQDLNRYAAFRGNPFRFADPSGGEEQQEQQEQKPYSLINDRRSAEELEAARKSGQLYTDIASSFENSARVTGAAIKVISKGLGLLAKAEGIGMIPLLAGVAEERVLEIGPGVGWNALRSTQQGFKTHTVDNSEIYFELMGRYGIIKALEEGGGSATLGDARQLSKLYEPGFFSRVDFLFPNSREIASRDFDLMLEGVNTVLQPGGKIHFATEFKHFLEQAEGFSDRNGYLIERVSSEWVFLGTNMLHVNTFGGVEHVSSFGVTDYGITDPPMPGGLILTKP